MDYLIYMTSLDPAFIKAEVERVMWDEIPDEMLVFDVETTGLEPKSHRILEIGAVLFNKADYLKTGEISTFQCFVKHPEPISAEITKINGITNEMVMDGHSEYEALERFFEFVGARDMYAYNGKFDKDFINAMAKRSSYSREPVIEEVIDIYKFIKENWEIKPNYKLTTVAKFLKIDSSGAHRAVKDSVLALHAYIQIQQKVTASIHIHNLEQEDWRKKNLTSIYPEAKEYQDKLQAELNSSKNAAAYKSQDIQKLEPYSSPKYDEYSSRIEVESNAPKFIKFFVYSIGLVAVFVILRQLFK